MGGRMASLLMAENSLLEENERLPIVGCACIGFPFHAPGKDPKDRLDHMKELKEPLLIVQGTRDAMGTKEEVEGYIKEQKINAAINLQWLEDGNHDLRPRKVSGFSHQHHIDMAIKHVAEFVSELSNH